MNTHLPTVADVFAAAARMRGRLVETPLLESATLNRLAGMRVLLKAECLQHSGSFKIRGALNRLLQLTEPERNAGVVAFSSGNHAQAVALASHWLGVRATIVMPSDAPAVKVAGTRVWGAEVVFYDRDRDDREKIAAELAAKQGAVLVPPFDDARIVAGQGTAALELAWQAQGCGATLDALYVPCSGGGLVAGSALAIKSFFPRCAVYAVEPKGYDDHARSLAAGERVRGEGGCATLCDGLRAPLPGELTFAINRRELAGAVAVDDAAVRAAMAAAVQHLKIVVEPSGAAALAAVLASPSGDTQCVGVILSGGNVDPPLLAEVLRDQFN
ncbi:MAG: threonine/serine dehydratase [Gammaproteobacteria bacterium]